MLRPLSDATLDARTLATAAALPTCRPGRQRLAKAWTGFDSTAAPAHAPVTISLVVLLNRDPASPKV